MKKILIVLLYVQYFCTLYSQVDSSAECFFPASIGNSWHYQYTQTQGYITTLTRDSVANGSRFLFFDSSSVPGYEIDSMLNVFSYPTTGYRALQYKLKAQKNEIWLVEGGIVAKIDDIYWSFVLNRLTQVKKIGYYSIHDTTNFSIWFYDRYLAAGFGFYLEITDAMQTPSEELYGCIIDGITYGKMTAVKDEKDNSVSTSYKLYTAYPNPFNPTTQIKFDLKDNGFVRLTVYDILGREVKILVNEYRPAGSYEVEFSVRDGSASGGNASKLASGIYFYKLQTDRFVDVKKMVLIR
jgi:hypothetical protein